MINDDKCTDTCGIFSKCLANRHLVWRVVICGDESFDSIASYRFNNIFNAPSQILAEYFLSVLQIIHPVWQVVICCDKSFDSSRIVSIRQHLQPPFTDTCSIFSKCLENRHPVWRVVICWDESFDSSQFDNIFNPLSHDTCGIKSLTNWLPVCVFMS